MRTFAHFPDNAICPVCQTNEDKECCLIPMAGTQEGNIIQVAPVHVDCILSNSIYIKDRNIIFCKSEKP